MTTTAQSRLSQIKDFLTMNKTATAIPFDPNSTKFPQRKDVPQAKYGPEGVATAWVWGENDMVNVFGIYQMDFVLKVPTDWSFKSPHTYESQSRGFERDQDWRHGSD